jgi:hypothetical protein
MRWIASFLLVSAAILKAVELVTEPMAALSNPFGRYFLPIEIGVEMAVGLLLLTCLHWGTLRWLVLMLFTGFAGYSLYLALNDAASCGCFGLLRVNPWWAFGLDSIVVLGLLVSILLEHRSNGSEFESSNAPFFTKFFKGGHVVTVVMGITVIFTALLFRYASQRTASTNGLLTTVGNRVVLEPEKWIGEKLPIAELIDLDLSDGAWIVLLHRHDCPLCQERVPQYERRAAAGERIALVEVPPYGDFSAREKTCRYGRLKDDRDWFVHTPVEITLRYGVVTAVKTEYE